MPRRFYSYRSASAGGTAVASRLPGTVVSGVMSEAAKAAPIIRIGHPCGDIEVEISLEKTGDGYAIRRAAYGRTARRIMEGLISLKPWADAVESL